MAGNALIGRAENKAVRATYQAKRPARQFRPARPQASPLTQLCIPEREDITRPLIDSQALCRSVGGMPAPEADPPADYCAQRSAMMPKRRRTRAQNRAARIATERRANHDARMARAESVTYTGPAPPNTEDDDPPPF